MIAQRSPAPIVEQTENPNPTAEVQTQPRHSTKSKHKTAEAEPAEQTKAEPVKPKAPQSRIAGVWTGIISVGILGTTEETLTINSTGTVVGEKNSFGSATHRATCDGTTVKFSAGALNEIAFTVTPNADGQTAVVTANSLFISNPSVMFRKTPNSEAVANSVSMPAKAEIPTARPVPEKPGFVYNPYDPTAKRLLDVTGKPSGTKVKDPSTGKTFIVP